jgi:UDP-N-acetyl-2-amino-2-deoxyglucuronate dehydrogenase
MTFQGGVVGYSYGTLDGVKLALVGCGGISGAHVRGYKDLYDRGCREFEVTACCDVQAERAETRAVEIAEFQGTKPRVYTDVQDLVRSGVAEAADICVPHCFHHSVAIPLLEGGIHAMIEKPLGITVKASRRIIEAAERNGRVLATGENVRRDLTARSCAWAINGRRLIGDVRLVSIQSVKYGPFDFTRPPAKWRGIVLLTGGGMIMDSGAHFADMVQVLFGEPDEVYCSMASYDGRMIEDAPVVGSVPADVEDTWHAVIRFKGGTLVTWTYSRALYAETVRQASYYGSEGTMLDLGFPFHPFQGGGNCVLADGSEVSSEQIQADYVASLADEDKARLLPYGATDGFAIEAWDFVNAIATGRRPEMDGYDGLRAKALCESCYESAIAGKPVRYADVLEGRIDAYQARIDEYWGL